MISYKECSVKSRSTFVFIFGLSVLTPSLARASDMCVLMHFYLIPGYAVVFIVLGAGYYVKARWNFRFLVWTAGGLVVLAIAVDLFGAIGSHGLGAMAHPSFLLAASLKGALAFAIIFLKNSGVQKPLKVP